MRDKNVFGKIADSGPKSQSNGPGRLMYALVLPKVFPQPEELAAMSHALSDHSESYLSELRLFIEDICCDLCLFDDALQGDACSGGIRVDREFHLGAPSTFADIRIAPAGAAPYFIEVKVGYSDAALVRHLARKYSIDTPQVNEADKVVLVVDAEDRPRWNEVEAALRAQFNPRLQLEVFDESSLQAAVLERLGVNVGAITEQQLLDVRDRIESALGFQAFGGESIDSYRNDPLRAELLWHLGASRLCELRARGRKTAREILPPKLYRGVAVLMADLSSFSSFVRDTPDPDVIRESLTNFYTKSRYKIVNGGGMLYQFVGDAVIGFFGVPEASASPIDDCLDAARALLDIGHSVSDHWQRQIDRVQPMGGAHIGLTIGDVEVLSLRPFSRTRIGAVSDSINMAARLLSAADAGQIVVSNSFYHKLDMDRQRDFVELKPLDARNVGRIKAWKLDLSERYADAGAAGK